MQPVEADFRSESDAPALELFDAQEPQTAGPPASNGAKSVSVQPPAAAPGVGSAPAPAPAPARWEAPKSATAPAARSSRRSPLMSAVIVLLSVLAVVEGFLLLRSRGTSVAAPAVLPDTGTLAIDSTPRGAAILINGEQRGQTPSTLTLKPGSYTVQIAHNGTERRLPVTVAAGASSTQHIFFQDVEKTGALQIASQPSGARVTIEGAARGVTPLTIPQLPPGQYTVVLDGASGSISQSVTVQAGTTSALTVTIPNTGASGGWLRVASPFDVQLFEGGSLLGSSETARIMLPAGRHVIEVVNTPLGYRATRTVQIAPGSVADLRLDVPSVNVDINAIPWAEVTVAGRNLGATPLGNVSLPIGVHELILRHPQLGERRVNATVRVEGPNRVSVNMNQK